MCDVSQENRDVGKQGCEAQEARKATASRDANPTGNGGLLKPYWTNGVADLLHGDAREVLRELPAESVHMVCTSPPYYGLRDYGLPPSVWGGDESHEHVWGKLGPAHHPGQVQDNKAVTAENAIGQNAGSGRFCPCGAWRGTLGLEPTPNLFVEHIVEVMRAVRRVMRPDATCWLNMGDSMAGSGKGQMGDGSHSLEHGTKQGTNEGTLTGGLPTNYPGLKPKDLLMMPARVALALQADGWWLRSDIIWAKPNPMPESVQGSHSIRHRVTIAEYEELSGLQSSQGASSHRAGDVSRVPTSKVPDCQAPLSTKSEGTGNDTGQGAAGGCAGEEASLQPLLARQEKQSEVRSNREGPSNPQENRGEVQSQPRSQRSSSSTTSTKQGQPETQSTTERGEQPLQEDREGQGPQASGICEAEKGEDWRSDSGRLDGDSSGPQGEMPLLSQAQEIDNRPCDTPQQGRDAQQGEHRPSMQPVQFEEGQSDSQALVDCPGCSKCINGYISRLSAGRPTQSHEHVFLLAKSATYYFDQEAVREKAEYGRGIGPGAFRSAQYVDGRAFDGTSHEPTGAHGHSYEGGRNLRDVWFIPTQPLTGVVVYGRHRTASPDCPIHGYHLDPEPSLECDAQQGVSPIGHNLRSSAHPFQELAGGEISEGEGRSEVLSDGSAATLHNSEMNRMDAALGPDGSSYDIPAAHTEYKEQPPHSAATSDHTPVSNTLGDDAVDEMGTGPVEQIHDRIADKPTEWTFDEPPVDCTCHYTGKVAKKIDHFAGYPEALVRPCVLAGTSERGVCPECSAPWERVVEGNTGGTTGKAWLDHKHDAERGNLKTGSSKGYQRGKTTSWEPSCTCGRSDTVPSLVLDPFAGSATTLIVAQKLGRRSVGIELSADYCALARKRLESIPLPMAMA